MSTASRTLTRTHGLALAILLALLPATALAQDCPISGPTDLCAGPATLCGPEWGELFLWIRPDGTGTEDRCILVDTPGTYQLRVYDMETNMWLTCERSMNVSAPVACSITGPTQGCVGSTVQLCGPTGTYDYEWTLPDASIAATACIAAGLPGSYSLRVREVGGCWGDPCSQDVAFVTCPTDTGSGDPPPPPQQSVTNCPRPATFWARQCGHQGDASNSIDALAFAAIAQCVDASHEVFSWSDPVEGFCQAVRPEAGDLRVRAKKQFAAAAANVCATSAGATSRQFGSVALDPATSIQLDGASTTVGAWLANAESELVRLEPMRLHSQAVKRAYRTLIRQGWVINHGFGMGAVCTASRRGDDATDLRIQSDRAAEPLAAELGMDNDVEVTVEPNPFTTQARISYAMTSAGEVTLGVYDVSGRLVRELARGTFTAGLHEVSWDGRDASGSRVHGGMYFVVARIGSERALTRVTMVQ